MNFKDITAVLKHFEKAVANSDPMPSSEKIVLRKLAELYEWEQLKKEFHGCLMKLAKARDKGLW